MGLRKLTRRWYFSLLQRFNTRDINIELSIIAAKPRFQPGVTNIFGKPFRYHDGLSFTVTYREIFQTGIYQFPSSTSSKIILDCGANMGLSVLYFSLNYPGHTVIAFEPDAFIFSILEENVKTFGLTNVFLHREAVWNKAETLTFFTDRGMGGRVENSYSGQNPLLIPAIRLKDYINSEIDFLKIDIEGAEDAVLRDCADSLSEVNNIFFEYHNDINKPQTLHELLELVKLQGFHYYVKESYTRKRPFMDKELTCEVFDMAINVFCYKNVHR